MIDRRAFIGAIGAASVAGVRLDAKKVQRLGMQLYTVRTEMEKDVDATLAKVAAIGYKEVEFAGYFKRTPAQIRDALKKADFKSLRGDFKFGVNNFPIQDFYLVKAAKRPDGKFQTEIVEKVFENYGDVYSKDCKPAS